MKQSESARPDRVRNETGVYTKDTDWRSLGRVKSRNEMVDDKPAGGHAWGPGFSISWQDKPLGQGQDAEEATGAFVETVVQAALDRLEFYQAGPFECNENDEAIVYLENALGAMVRRTKRRVADGTEGTHAEKGS